MTNAIDTERIVRSVTRRYEGLPWHDDVGQIARMAVAAAADHPGACDGTTAQRVSYLKTAAKWRVQQWVTREKAKLERIAMSDGKTEWSTVRDVRADTEMQAMCAMAAKAAVAALNQQECDLVLELAQGTSIVAYSRRIGVPRATLQDRMERIRKKLLAVPEVAFVVGGEALGAM